MVLGETDRKMLMLLGDQNLLLPIFLSNVFLMAGLYTMLSHQAVKSSHKKVVSVNTNSGIQNQNLKCKNQTLGAKKAKSSSPKGLK